MTVLFHPEFPQDIRRFDADYLTISEGLAARFRREVDAAIEAVKASPRGAGHLLQPGCQRAKRSASAPSTDAPFPADLCHLPSDLCLSVL